MTDWRARVEENLRRQRDEVISKLEKVTRERDEARNIGKTAMGVLEHLSYSDSEIDGFEEIVEMW
jgi:hypothetical protein